MAFVRGAQGSLLQLAWLLTGDVHRAEELVQDTLVRSYGAWPRIRHGDPFAYTRRVLVNAKIDSWRRRRNERLVERAPDPDGAAPDLTAGVDHRLAVVAALRTLSPRERAVLVLRYLVDLSEADTADELGVSVGTVKSTASRALAKLRNQSDRAPAAVCAPGSRPVPVAGEGGRP